MTDKRHDRLRNSVEALITLSAEPDESGESDPAFSALCVAQAQVYATLALVAAQRDANRIALITNSDIIDSYEGVGDELCLEYLDGYKKED